MNISQQNRFLLKIWALCVSLIVGLTSAFSMYDSTIQKWDIVSFVIFIIEFAYFTIASYFFLGKEKQSKKIPYEFKKLSVWAYTWRILINYTITVFVYLILVSSIRTQIPIPTAILFIVLTTVLYPFVFILFFCANKKEKIKDIISLFRGY